MAHCGDQRPPLVDLGLVKRECAMSRTVAFQTPFAFGEAPSLRRSKARTNAFAKQFLRRWDLAQVNMHMT